MSVSLLEERPWHLKSVSRIKHVILQKYLSPWETILGAKHRRLVYVDCYAGPGAYECEGRVVDGSPVIALKSAERYISSRTGRELTLIFVEKDNSTRSLLEEVLEEHYPLPAGLHVHVLAEDAKDFVSALLDQVPNLAPSFFMVDPYGHPLSIPILNRILQRKYAEALITFMFFRINMDVSDPKAQHRVDEMFGSSSWQAQAFLNKHGKQREEELLAFFCQQIDARYRLPFKIQFDWEDNMPQSRTKYYLIHASNHPKAALLMKQVMWPLGDEEGLFRYSGSSQARLFSESPTEDELRRFLLQRYAGRKISFDDLREETWDWPFIERHYRSVIKGLEKDGLAKISRISSKRTGLKEQDLVHILLTTNMREV